MHLIAVSSFFSSLNTCMSFTCKKTCLFIFLKDKVVSLVNFMSKQVKI